MAFDIFSKRDTRRGQPDDVYQYEEIPSPAKVQIVHLWKRAIGDGSEYNRSKEVYCEICNTLREEYGVFHLCGERNKHISGFNELVAFFLQEKDIKRCLDAIELTMRASQRGWRDEGTLRPVKAQHTLNIRLREAAVGYQFDGGEIIRVDSQLIHAEVVKPAIRYLSDPVFRGANDEFMEAHKNYRSGDYKACLVEALKSFESTMKVICQARGWAIGQL
jgi:hypothetical protein